MALEAASKALAASDLRSRHAPEHHPVAQESISIVIEKKWRDWQDDAEACIRAYLIGVEQSENSLRKRITDRIAYLKRESENPRLSPDERNALVFVSGLLQDDLNASASEQSKDAPRESLDGAELRRMAQDLNEPFLARVADEMDRLHSAEQAFRDTPNSKGLDHREDGQPFLNRDAADICACGCIRGAHGICGSCGNCSGFEPK